MKIMKKEIKVGTLIVEKEGNRVNAFYIVLNSKKHEQKCLTMSMYDRRIFVGHYLHPFFEDTINFKHTFYGGNNSPTCT